MKSFLNTIIFLVSASLSPNIIAYPEIPFCPAGGAPGWMNYMDYKRDQNIWQHNHYASRYPPLNYARFSQYAPNYTPYRSVETTVPRYYYNSLPNNYRNTTYAPGNYSGYTAPIR